MPVEQLIIRAGKKPLSPRGIMRMDGCGVNSQPRLVGPARRQWGCGDHAYPVFSEVCGRPTAHCSRPFSPRNVRLGSI